MQKVLSFLSFIAILGLVYISGYALDKAYKDIRSLSKINDQTNEIVKKNIELLEENKFLLEKNKELEKRAEEVKKEKNELEVQLTFLTKDIDALLLKDKASLKNLELINLKIDKIKGPTSCAALKKENKELKQTNKEVEEKYKHVVDKTLKLIKNGVVSKDFYKR